LKRERMGLGILVVVEVKKKGGDKGEKEVTKKGGVFR
jgi:hypothetical protein